MEVSLDGAYRPAQCLGQGLHLGPAQARFVVGVVREGTVGRDSLGRNSGEDEGLDLGDTGEFGLVWHCRLLFNGAAVRSGVIECPKAAGSRAKGTAPPLFLCSFSVGYSTYTGILALAPLASPSFCTIAPVLYVSLRGLKMPVR